jgi:retron-type reverse transcriptase
LSNTTVKIITKLLANNLQSAIIPLIHENQYGFIKSRTIQDCLGWAFEYIYQCHKSKRECIILKLDFTKAFDTIEHNTIIQMLIHKGFPETWIRWINAIFETETTSVLLNGVPGKFLHQRRGVRQGDPFSPLLFVLAADLLQSVVNKAFQQGLLSLPIPPRDDAAFPIV